MSSNQNPLSKDEILSLQGCKAERFRFEFGTPLDPSAVTFHVSCGEVNSPSTHMKAKVVIFDRYGWQYVDGVEEAFDTTMAFMREEVLMRKELEIAAVKIKDVRAIAERENISLEDPDRPLWKIRDKAFIQITLKWQWEEHTVEFGNLLNTLPATIAIFRD